MSKRRYTKIQEMLPIIKAKLAEGKTHREIESELGLEGERPIHSLLKRERRKERDLINGKLIRSRGRPRKESPEAELERLRMENKLLRNFLQSTERK